MADQQFCLRWNNHQSTLISVFDTLLENGTLVDCTLAAEGQYLKAHKVVLSACSPYLETLLSQHYEKHPIVILKDVKFSELKSMMDYMYRGEVNISQDQLGTFLKAAESLQIKGLSDNGAEGDARDVGSTPKAPPPQRKATQPAPSSRPAEPQRPDVAPESPAHRSRDGSISPSSRKRRRIRRNSQGDDSNLGDSHLDTSNSCDLPSQAQSTPIVPNIPATVTSSVTTTPIIKTPIVKPEQTELVNRIDTNSLPPESGLLKEKIEPISEPLLEPKTEYLDDVNNDDSVEDLTLDDDDDMEGMDISNMSNMSNMSRPGPSHGNDVSLSNQGFAPWHLGGNQTGTDEVFMAAQEAVGAHRDSQGGLEQSELVMSHEDDFEAVFVVPSKVKPNEEFFSELNNLPVPDSLTTTNTEKLCLGKETDQVKIINNSQLMTNYTVETVGADLYLKPENNTKIPLPKKVKTEYEQTKLQSSEDWQPQQLIDDSKSVEATEKQKYLSSRGRRRKLLTWSGDSFNVKEFKSEEDNKSSADKKKESKTVSRTKASEYLKNNIKKFRRKSNYKEREFFCHVVSVKSKKNTELIKGEGCTLSHKMDKDARNTEVGDKVLATHSTVKNKIELGLEKEERTILVHEPGNYKCHCGRAYVYKRGLRHHQKYACGKKLMFTCKFCGMRANYKGTLKKHIKTHHMSCKSLEPGKVLPS